MASVPATVKTDLMSSPFLGWLNDPAKRDLCKRTFCKGASDDEFELFLLTGANSGLDPFKRQLFLVPRWDAKLSRYIYLPQTSVDGFRVTAERSGKYAGQLGPYWCGDDGQWVEVWLKKTPPAAARVGVMRSDFKEPLWAVARFDAYVQLTKQGHANSMWTKMPEIMLAKCAESLAIRKAFPDQTAGLYTQEEMGQAVVDVTPETESPIPPSLIVENKQTITTSIAKNGQLEKCISTHPGDYVIEFGTIYKGKSISSVLESEGQPAFERWLDILVQNARNKGFQNVPPYQRDVFTKYSELREMEGWPVPEDAEIEAEVERMINDQRRIEQPHLLAKYDRE